MNLLGHTWYTQLYSPSNAWTIKKQTKQRKNKPNKTLQNKSNTTAHQHSSILGLIFSTQSTNDIIGYGHLAQKSRCSITYRHRSIGVDFSKWLRAEIWVYQLSVLNVTCTKMQPNVEKCTRRDRSRCDDMRYRTKMTFYVPRVSPACPDNDSDHAKCGGVYYRLRL